jgi:hypothetical protein
MKIRRIMLVASILLLVTSFIIYKYVYLSGGTCIQVVVSATSRLSGKTEVFGNPCIIPFWYKEVREYNPAQKVGDMSSGISQEKIGVSLTDNLHTTSPSVERKTYRNDKYGFSIQYPADFPVPDVFINSTSTIRYDPSGGDVRFELYFFDDPVRFQNRLYNEIEDGYDQLSFSSVEKSWVVTSRSDSPACPPERKNGNDLTYYTIRTGHHAGDGIEMYVTTRGLVLLVGADEIASDPEGKSIITFYDETTVLKVGCRVIKK